MPHLVLSGGISITDMMTLSNGISFCVTGPSCGNSPDIHRSPVNSLHKGQWCGALMFSLICAWINGWVNNRDADDLRRHRGHYDVTVCNGNLTKVYTLANGLYKNQQHPAVKGTFLDYSLPPKRHRLFVHCIFKANCIWIYLRIKI